jgi:hypothetical protein
MSQPSGTRFYRLPQTFIGRMLALVLGAALLVAAFFFLFFFLVIAAIALFAFSIRALWRARKVAPSPTPDIIEGEFSVETPVLQKIEAGTAANDEKH